MEELKHKLFPLQSLMSQADYIDKLAVKQR